MTISGVKNMIFHTIYNQTHYHATYQEVLECTANYIEWIDENRQLTAFILDWHWMFKNYGK